jgi:hypothetical protein
MTSAPYAGQHFLQERQLPGYEQFVSFSSEVCLQFGVALISFSPTQPNCGFLPEAAGGGTKGRFQLKPAWGAERWATNAQATFKAQPVS